MPPAEADGRAALDAIGADAAAERASQCSVPREGGWRPGARWARGDPAAGSGLADSRAQVTAAVEALPGHRRPPQRELGRVSEAADNPFRRGLSRPPEERVAAPAPLRELSRRSEAAVPPFRPGARGWQGEDLHAAVAALPTHQRPRSGELSRKSEVIDHPFRPMPSDEFGPTARMTASMPSLQFPGEDAPSKAGRGAALRSDDKRERYRNEAPVAALSIARAAAVTTGAQGRFFQTGRTLGSVVARVCRDEPPPGDASPSAEPPLVTTHKIGSRVEIAACNPAARALGLSPGTALTMARAQVPGLAVREADPAGDAADLLALAELLARRWAPMVAVSDADGLFIDLTGVAHLYGGEARFLRRLVRLLARHGVTARVAIADTAGAAWALARFGGGMVRPGEQAAAIAPLPVAALRLDGSALELLARLGVDTIGQLSAMPRAPLVRRFGRAIADRLDQATGHAPEPLDPVVPPTRIAVEQRFAEPIATPEAIEHWLGELMPRLTVALAEAGQGARAVELVAARVDGVVQRLRLGFARPTRDAAHMLRLALRRIEEIEPGYGLDAIALHVRRADPLGPESLARALSGPVEPDLTTLVDAIANRIGLPRLWRVTPVESDVPERSLAMTSPLDALPGRAEALKPDDVRRLDERARDHPWHPRWPRPVRLLHRPEPVDHVVAELPDQPPRRFTWRGVTHRVVRAEGPERITGEWWRRAGERLSVRDYFRVEDELGERFWLYRRGDGVRTETGDLRWFLHGR